MEKNVKEQLSQMLLCCRRLSAAGLRINSSMPEPENYLRFALAKFMIYVSMIDGAASKTETALINRLLDTSFSESDIERVSAKDNLNENDLMNTLRNVCIVFAKGQKSGVDCDCLAFVSFINNVGVNLIASDENTDERETSFIVSLVFRLRVFCNTYIESLSNAPAKKQEESDTETADEENRTIDKRVEELESKPKETLEELLEQLNSLVGLSNVKQEVYSLSNLIKVRKLREERGFVQPAMSLHLVFTGNPGTGKTTVARLISKIYNRLGVLPKDNLVEVDRSGLVSGYVGKTALKTLEVCESALGGVLFIDEAYALTSNTGKNDFGGEAVNTLLKFMEDHRSDFVVICAGYTDLMEEFLQSNPGLRSRFNRFIKFEDYSAHELTDIFKLRCDSYKLKVEEDALETVRLFFEMRVLNKTETFANGRDVRNYFEKAISNQADRLAELEDITDEQLVTITKADVENIEL